VPDLPVRNPYVLALTATPDDVDVQGRVSNVAVVDWIIRAAIAHSADLGWDHARYVEIGGFFVVRRHEIDYLAVASDGDRITVFTWPSGIEKASAERRYVVVRDDDVVVAQAVSIWGFVDAATGRPKRIPADIAATFDPARFA